MSTIETREAETMKLRIVSDGTAKGTRVETEAGELVTGVQSVTWSIDDPSPRGRAMIGLVGVPVEVYGRLAAQVNDKTASPDVLGGALRGAGGRCTCPCGKGTDPSCPVHP